MGSERTYMFESILEDDIVALLVVSSSAHIRLPLGTRMPHVVQQFRHKLLVSIAMRNQSSEMMKDFVIIRPANRSVRIPSNPQCEPGAVLFRCYIV